MSDTFINGNRTQFADVSMSADGGDIPVGALKSLNFSSSLEPGVLAGNSIYSPGLTNGSYTASADFEMLQSESDAFESDLTDDGSVGLYQTDFDIQASFALSDESYVETVNLRGCRIKSRELSASAGTDGLYYKYTLVVRRVARNGRPDAIQ